MTEGWLQIALFVVVLVALTKPLGVYMARVFGNQRVFLTPVLGPIERTEISRLLDHETFDRVVISATGPLRRSRRDRLASDMAA